MNNNSGLINLAAVHHALRLHLDRLEAQVETLFS